MATLQDIESKSKTNIRMFLIILFAITILIGGYISYQSDLTPILMGVVALFAILSFPVVARYPEMLFYVYMASFVFGVIGFQISNSLPKVSFSNLLFMYAPVLLLFLAATNRRSLASVLFGNSRRTLIIIGSLALLFQVFIAGVLNSSLRFLITQLGYFLVVFVILYVVHDLKVLRRGLLLGILSIGILSTLTILTSMGVISFGFRVDWNSGTAPWESILPRAVGLPQMDGGYHGVFILSFLPLASLLAIRGMEQGVFSRGWLYYVTFAGLAAIAIAIFRSAWLGIGFSAAVIIMVLYRKYMPPKPKATIAFVAPFLLIIFTFLFVKNFSLVKVEFNNFFFKVRQRGVETRIEQYKYSLERVFSSPRTILFGYGYGSFREDFYNLGEADLSNAIGLHNHFLGFLYANGLPYLIVYLFLIFLAIRWLYLDAVSNKSRTRLLSLGLLAGLIGDIVVLNFTAALSGYKIIWVIIAIAALLPELNGELTPQQNLF